MDKLDAMKCAIAIECGCDVQDTHQAAQVALDASYEAGDFELMSASSWYGYGGGRYRSAATLRIKPAAFDMTRDERKSR